MGAYPVGRNEIGAASKVLQRFRNGLKQEPTYFVAMVYVSNASTRGSADLVDRRFC